MKRAFIVLALLVVVALPFVLRPKRTSAARTDATIVIITPHNEAIRYEYSRGFAKWYQSRTGRTVSIDWRVIGGTSEIARFLEGEYSTAFENYWRRGLGKPWSADVEAGFSNGRLPADAPAIVREARAAFLASNVTCGIDVFFGGGTYDFDRQARAGRLVDSGLRRLRPEWFTDQTIPRRYGGEDYWHADGLWIGTVLSTYGILFNRDALRRVGFDREPAAWSDLADPRLIGEVGLADPTKSGSVAKAFENILQQQMQGQLHALENAEPGMTTEERERRAAREGWIAGMRLLQRIGANARYFTDSSQKPPIDVAAGNCAAGLCIDFYGRQQQEAVRRRSGSRSAKDVGTGDHGRDARATTEKNGRGGSATAERLGYVSPEGGSVASVDPVALLRGAPNREAAIAFIEYTLSMEGQMRWNFRPGTPGGPERFALRRLPVRRDFYAHEEWKAWRSDPEESPFAQRDPLIYREAWTGNIFREMAFVVRILCQDTHRELTDAWRAINAAPEPAKTRALAVMQDLSAVDYERTTGEIRRRLGSRDKVDEVRLARELGDFVRANYARAKAIATER
ncbi:MAG: ABC transporter substrate-binding protein [Opitutaceae bacterium]|nr:ABC transporter substrate-binding protein [Opitutaceae bacterium]